MRSARLRFFRGRLVWYMALLALLFSLAVIANPAPVYADRYTESEPADYADAIVTQAMLIASRFTKWARQAELKP